ncbi:MAG: FtsX-like permease family protein [Methanobrevibacter sp.]|jgi:putative ABC transport system permease protein|nr:FtsX-like permease family protein [Candidatus Methanovirga procula]
MSFKKFILKSSFRKKSKAIYQLSGITIPILIILFFAINMQTGHDLQEKFNPSSDIYIIGSPDGNHFSLPINESLIAKIKKDDRIENAVGTISGRFNINGVNCRIIGVNSSDADFMKMVLQTGRKFKNDEKEIVLSNNASEQLNKSVGEYISIDKNEYKIVGITVKVKSFGNSFYTSLKNAQELNILDNNVSRNYGSGNVESIWIKTKDGENNIKITEDLKNQYINENINVMGPDEETEKSFDYQKNINRIIFIFVPTVIGILLTLIIMMKSVGDRTREIGVLKSVGWKSRRIFTMIVSETFIISIASFIIASIIAILITFLMNLMNPYYTVDLFTFLKTLSPLTFLHTFIIVVVMAFLGAMLPAIRASRLSPAEAVREE